MARKKAIHGYEQLESVLSPETEIADRLAEFIGLAINISVDKQAADALRERYDKTNLLTTLALQFDNIDTCAHLVDVILTRLPKLAVIVDATKVGAIETDWIRLPTKELPWKILDLSKTMTDAQIRDSLRDPVDGAKQKRETIKKSRERLAEKLTKIGTAAIELGHRNDELWNHWKAILQHLVSSQQGTR